ncbi:hypothetical protein [Actinomadura gamaensis]|uniref:Uncharacterized protein n=1 Tax=Actinomadura gamaensis TaxID=1763541 RepID=A0ABV9U2Q8_9ACTN
MKYWIAAGLTFAGGAALSSAVYGEGAVNTIALAGVPGLLAALFLAPMLSSGRSRDLARAGIGAVAVLVVLVTLLAAADSRYLALGALLGILLLSTGWPLAASAAALMVVASVRAGRSRVTAPRTFARMSWTWTLALAATYGYGLDHFDADMADVKDGVCRVTPGFSEAWSGRGGGGQSLLPLSDTTCGADTVPGFVNPLLAVLTALLVACLAGYGGARLRASRTPPAA